MNYYLQRKKHIYLFSMLLFLAPQVWAQHEHPAGHTGQEKTTATGKIVSYDLYVKDTIVNYTGKKVEAIAVNGQIPAPTLHFTEGDKAVIRVHNQLKEETSTHWHGLLLPFAQDGVPYINTPPIHAGKTHTFEFPIKQSGTYWYHSHTRLQEQKGLYGSIVIHPKDEPQQSKELVMLMSDWTNENPQEVLRSLRRATDWYAIKKGHGVTQSWGEALVAGYLKDKFIQEWQRMAPMDVSDVYYNRFLINGLPKSDYQDINPGDTVKLRLINGSASTYFWVHYAGGPMTVVAADGIDVQPVIVDRLMIAVAETYDVLVTVPKEGSYEFRATAQDISGYGSAFLGKGTQITATDLPRLNYFAMMREMNQMMKGGHVMGQHNPVVAETLTKGGNRMKTMNHEGMSTNNKEKQPEPSTSQMQDHQGHTMPSSDSSTKKQSQPSTQSKNKNKDGTVQINRSKHHYPMSERQGNVSKDKAKNMSAMDHKGMKTDGDMREDTSKEKHTMPADSMSNMEHKGHTMPMEPDTMMSHENMQKKDTSMSLEQHQGHAMLEAKQEDTMDVSHQGHQMGEMTMWGPSMMNPQARPGEVLLSYKMLKSVKPSALNPSNPVQDVSLTLTGNMNRYVWGMNGKTLSESAYIPIKKGHNIRFIITNGTMMRHPMHLHGHFFRLLNGQGANAPLKHTFDSEPMATDTLEFYASEEKDWLFHCHILYHMLTGMHRIVRYEGTTPDPALVSHPGYKKHMREDREFFSWGEVALHSQGAFADFAFENTRYGIELEGRMNWKGEYETETHVLRYFGRNQFLQVVAGTDFRRNKTDSNDGEIRENSKDFRQVAHIGVRYMLPLFIQGELRLDHTGKVRAQLRRLDWGLTKRLRMDWMVNTDKEYSIVMRYVLKKHVALSGNYDSDYGFGGGLSFIW